MKSSSGEDAGAALAARIGIVGARAMALLLAALGAWGIAGIAALAIGGISAGRGIGAGLLLVRAGAGVGLPEGGAIGDRRGDSAMRIGIGGRKLDRKLAVAALVEAKRKFAEIGMVERQSGTLGGEGLARGG